MMKKARNYGFVPRGDRYNRGGDEHDRVLTSMPEYAVFLLIYFALEAIAMTDLNRGIMKFRGADSGAAIVLSACFILGGIAFLIVWALQTAYPLA
ncbi:MAG: hypothetical protein HC895_12105 [Leptolyngbyaceae cyanobacterium SM1_3_5]|nr:hypothetical protein [Leptolyngbyaceae cyanobacterium SM1_3_5]